METKPTKLSDFQILGKLGQGAFGQVFKVKRLKDGQIYALKKVKISAMKQKDRQNALNQIRILASYDGQYIIGYKDSFYDQLSSYLCVVMEFAGNGDLLKINQQLIKKKLYHQQKQIWKALVHITKGVKSLHDRKILHRDLKAANIFKTNDDVYKLGDLNVSKVLKKDLARTQTGTPYYVSPEIWKDKPYGIKSDMWSLGCVIYQMAALRPPFIGTDLQSLYKNVCRGVYTRIPPQFSEQLWQIITSLLKQDPSLRPSTQQLLQNPIIHKNFLGQINIQKNIKSPPQLIKTLKFNHKDLKALKNILPKSNYSLDKSIDSKSQKQSIQNNYSNRRKSIKQIMNQKKINNFLEIQRKRQQQNRQRLLKAMDQAKQLSYDQKNKKRERIFSAGRIRHPQQCRTPQPAKKQLANIKLPPSTKNVRKQYPNKLPPKPQGNIQVAPRVPKITPIENNPSIDHSRDKSKQNFRNIGQKIIHINQCIQQPRARSSSVKKIVYPSWWMD